MLSLDLIHFYSSVLSTVFKGSLFVLVAVKDFHNQISHEFVETKLQAICVGVQTTDKCDRGFKITIRILRGRCQFWTLFLVLFLMLC